MVARDHVAPPCRLYLRPSPSGRLDPGTSDRLRLLWGPIVSTACPHLTRSLRLRKVRRTVGRPHALDGAAGPRSGAVPGFGPIVLGVGCRCLKAEPLECLHGRIAAAPEKIVQPDILAVEDVVGFSIGRDRFVGIVAKMRH